MEFAKSPPALLATLARLAASRAAGHAVGPGSIEQRKMFGYPALFVNRNMFAGLFADTMVLRLPDIDRRDLVESGQAAPFVAMGRTMREWVALAPALIAAEAELAEWLGKALAHTAAMPPKPAKAKRARE